MNNAPSHDEENSQDVAVARKRLRGFAMHLAGYFLIIIALAGVNLMTTPENLWVIAPMVGWGAFLAIHAAHAMGLFDSLFGKD